MVIDLNLRGDTIWKCKRERLTVRDCEQPQEKKYTVRNILQSIFLSELARMNACACVSLSGELENSKSYET